MEHNKLSNEDIQKTPFPRKTLLLGLIVFILSFFAPLFIPLVLKLNISASLKALISGFLVLGLPEIGMLLAVAILGQDGFLYLKSQLFLLLKQSMNFDSVGRTRYRIGICLFSITLILGFLMPYINYFFSIPIQDSHFHLIFISDFLFFISLLILGGIFGIN